MQMEKGINEKAKTEDSQEAIINSLIDTVRREEPVIPVKQRPSVKQPASQQTKSQQRHQDTPVSLPRIVPMTITDRLILKAHFAHVYCGAWTPDGRYLATGSGDATATIWEIKNHEYVGHYVLDHATAQDRSSKDIATLAWNPEGNILATGCYDGSARLWTNRGDLKFVLRYHNEAVFTVHFSPNGQLLLTGSADHRVIAWSVATGERRHVFQIHTSRVLDVCWHDDTTFASCSGDSRIAICQIGRATPIQILEGHRGEVNKIEWDSSGELLASCSDDKTVRVWRPFGRLGPITLTGHTHHVYTIKWAPGDRKVLASGAFDYTVRLWDVMTQSCICVVQKHQQPIYTIGFSPRGKFFVSGGIDNIMNMWRTEDAALVASYDAGSGIFEAQWDSTGKNIALCLSDQNVAVINTELIPYYKE